MNPFCDRKILGHLPILNAYLGGEWYPPIQVELDLTNACTSACPWCAGFLNREQSKAAWQTDRAIALLYELAAIGAKSITWTGGGDPTCHRDWLALVHRARELGLDNGFITNGVIDVSAAVPYCRWIRFSVDAATEATYGQQHGRPKHFQRVIENVSRAAHAKKEGQHDCTVGVGMVTSEGTRHEIIAFAELWEFTPVDYIQYRPLLDTHGQEWFSDNQETIALIRQAAQRDNRVVWSEPKYDAMVRGEDGRTARCHGVFLETAIAADGKVYTCCHHKGNPAFAVGDLNRETFTEVWRRHLENRRFDVVAACPSYCRHLGTNAFIEREVLAPRQHENFI